MEKTYLLFRSTFLESWLENWKNSGQKYPFISYQDIKKGYSTYTPYGGTESEDKWLLEWKEILQKFNPANKEDFEKKNFETMYFYKYYDENKINDMLKE